MTRSVRGDVRGAGTAPSDDREQAADELGDDERRHAARCDAGERVGERSADRDRGVGEAGRGREPVRRRDVAADRERGHLGRGRTRTTPRITSSSPKVATTSPSQSARRSTGCGWTRSTAGSSNMRLATIAPTHAPATCAADVHAARRAVAMPPSTRSARVTTGLKCAPDTGPSARISATSAAPVAIEFSSSCSPTSSGERRCAEMPEPTTTATSSAVPDASAVARRARSMVKMTPAVSSSERPTPVPSAQHSGRRLRAATVRSSPGAISTSASTV